MKTFLSGIQATGKLHLGNYFGAIKQFLDLQKEHEGFVMIADYHALNTVQDKEKIQASSVCSLISDCLKIVILFVFKPIANKPKISD